jgi:hypothetical protein
MGFQPRVGLAYSPDKKTVIRAGFGIFDDRYALLIPVHHVSAARPFLQMQICLRIGEARRAQYELNQYPYIPVPGVPRRRRSPPTFSRMARWYPMMLSVLLPPDSSRIQYTDRKSPIAYSEQASLEINRDIGHGFTVGAGYMFVAAHHLLRSTLGNLCPVQGVSGGAYPCAAAGPPPPGYPTGKNYYSGVPRYPAGLICCNDLTGICVSRRHFASEQERGQVFHHQRQLHASHTLTMALCNFHQRSRRRFDVGWSGPRQTRTPDNASCRTSRSRVRPPGSCEISC